MRAAVLAFGLVANACSGGEVEPERSGVAAQAESAEQAVPGAVLSAGGLTIGSTALRIGDPREQVESGVLAALGEPTERMSNEDCGAGPMQFTHYHGGLILSFQEDRFVGWYTDGESGKVASAIAVGSEGSAALASLDASLVDSTLGAEFWSESRQIGGFLEGEGEHARVSGLYSGTTCFFR